MTAEKSAPRLALRARLYFGEREHPSHQLSHAAIVEATRTEGLRGAAVLKAKGGYGEPSIVHAARVVDLAFDLPIVIEPTDRRDRIVAHFSVAYGLCTKMFIGVGGSYLIGIVIASVPTLAAFNPLWRIFWATGVLEGYTASSTFSYEALNLGVDGLDLMTLLYVAFSIIGAISGVATAKAIGG